LTTAVISWTPRAARWSRTVSSLWASHPRARRRFSSPGSSVRTGSSSTSISATRAGSTSLDGTDAPAGAISGTAEEIADAFRTFSAAGFTRLEMMISPQTTAALDAMVPVLEFLDAD
jgi:hypothetical protein